MSPAQITEAKGLADVYSAAISAYALAIGENEAPLEVLITLQSRARAARGALHAYLDSLVEPVMPVIPMGEVVEVVYPEHQARRDYVAGNFNIAVALLDRELARSKA